MFEFVQIEFFWKGKFIISKFDCFQKYMSIIVSDRLKSRHVI